MKSLYALLASERRNAYAATLTAILAASVGLVGCGIGNSDSSAPSTGAFTLTGGLHGGQQPVMNASVKLYRTGTSGYGSASTLLATTTTDASGGFAFAKSATNSDTVNGTTPSWGCPTTGDPQIYLLAIGGNTQGQGPTTTTSGGTTTTTSQSNPAVVMLASLGACSSISASTYVQINELSTVANVTALQQYLNPGTSTPGTATIGTASTTQAAQGLINAQSVVPNLYTNSSGAPTGTSTVINAGITVTITPETAKLVTMANILAACINSNNGVTTTTTTTGGNTTTSNSLISSAACQDLFNAATPPLSASTTSQPSATFNTAVDTLQAAYYMAVNPSDAGTVASCQTSTSGSTNLACLFNLQSAFAPFGGGLTSAPTDWTLGINYSSTSACTKGSFLAYPYAIDSDALGNIWTIGGTLAALSELSPAGVPQTCAAGTLSSGRGLAIDTTGNVWLAAATGAGVQRYNPSTASLVSFGETGVAPYAIVADGSGNIFYTAPSPKTVRELPGAVAASAAVTGKAIGGTITATPYAMAVDQTGRIWVTDSSATEGLYDFYPDTSANANNGYTSVNVGGSTTTYVNYAVAVDGSNTIWVPNASTQNTLGKVVPASASTATITTSSALAGGMINPRNLAIDGAGNVWTANVTTSFSGLYAVSEFSASGTAMSPTIAAGASSSNGGYQKPATISPNPFHGMTIDISGNVWLGNNTSTGTSIAEIVGAAVPRVMPLSLQLKNGTVATKP